MARLLFQQSATAFEIDPIEIANRELNLLLECFIISLYRKVWEKVGMARGTVYKVLIVSSCFGGKRL